MSLAPNHLLGFFVRLRKGRPLTHALLHERHMALSVVLSMGRQQLSLPWPPVHWLALTVSHLREPAINVIARLSKMAAPIRDTGRLRLLDQQARLRDQIARNVARPGSAAAPRGRKAAPGPGLSLEPPMPKPRERRATAANLAEARRTLGDAVGLKPFKDYVRRTYGEIDDGVLREFLRGGENTQLFSPPPRSEGMMATTGHKDSWYLDLIELRKGDPKYKFIMTAQNAYTGYLFALSLIHI